MPSWRINILMNLALLLVAPATSTQSADVAPHHQSPEFSADGRSVIYDGEIVRLSKRYSSYESYLADPNNIDSTENAHVAKLMSETELPRSFKTRAEAFDAAFSLKFPGYGSWSLKTQDQSGGAELRVFAVEIPRADKTRYVAITGGADGYTLIDDFVAPSALKIVFVLRSGDALSYIDRHGTVLLKHQVMPKQ